MYNRKKQLCDKMLFLYDISLFTGLTRRVCGIRLNDQGDWKIIKTQGKVINTDKILFYMRA